MKTLVIAEKPSVAQDIVRALTTLSGKFDKAADHFENDRYVVTSAIGHLLEIQVPEAFDMKRGKWSFAHLPVIPPHFDLKPIDKTRSRLNAVVKLIKRKDLNDIVNACDAGREGELIFRLIQQYSKTQLPVKRLWLQSMTPQAIRDAFANLRSDEQMQPLADAARCRSEADWLVGINGTRAMTAFNSRDGGFFLTTVGRVQTPTLSVVVEREEQIRKFICRDYWEVQATFQAKAGSYPGKWFDSNWKKSDDAELRADRLWSEREALAIAAAVREQQASVTEESRPTTQACPALFDLTSLQREANGRFGFSAKSTLSLAQSLYERHKAVTYPRTGSRALPEDYLPVVRKTLETLARSGLRHLAPHAALALKNDYIKPNRRVFDNARVSDHFAIIPTLQAPSGLSEAEQKLFDLIARRFIAVFYPSAEYLVTSRISRVAQHGFRTEGKVLVNAGWLAVYDKVADDAKAEDSAQLAALQPGEKVRVESVEAKAQRTRPPARYSEATLLGAMEGAGKLVEDEELRQAMQDKGLGTPATRSAIIEGLLTEKYMHREGRELIPTAKAFQLMTLLRGLGVEELSRAELTGEWEYRLAQMEHGKLSRDAFMADIASMTERMVRKAKEFDRDTVPGDYVTLHSPCPNCGGVVKENYRRYACIGKPDAGPTPAAATDTGCGFSFGKTPAGRTFETEEVETLMRERRIGPLEGFRSKAGWPFSSELTIMFDQESGSHKLEFDFGEDRKAEASGELVDLSHSEPLGACPRCASQVHEWGSSYVCEKSVPTLKQPVPSCSFKSGKIILQQPVSREQMGKLLATGKTDLLDKFVSMRTRRGFKAFLVWDGKADKVAFEFEPRKSKFPARKGVASKSLRVAEPVAAYAAAPAKKAVAKKVAAVKKVTAAKKVAKAKPPQKSRR